ncbi:hypothetical protein ACFVXW_24055 [Streptomyces sp. NPDC058251]
MRGRVCGARPGSGMDALALVRGRPPVVRVALASYVVAFVRSRTRVA